jgi:hypothetical protein
MDALHLHCQEGMASDGKSVLTDNKGSRMTQHDSHIHPGRAIRQVQPLPRRDRGPDGSSPGWRLPGPVQRSLNR